MGTFLSKALGKYYEREGNRVVFKDGISLNQLALAMWERLGYKEIDGSVVSRVVGGERLFTLDQLKVLSTILNLTQSQKFELEFSLLMDLGKRSGFQSSFLQKILKSPPVIESDEMESIRREYARELIEKDTDEEGSIRYWEQQKRRFLNAEFKYMLPELDEVERTIKVIKLSHSRKGKLWLSATNALRAEILTHFMPQSDLIRDPYIAHKRLELAKSLLFTNNPFTPTIIYSWSAVMRQCAEALVHNEGKTKRTLNLFIDTIALKRKALKLLGENDSLRVQMHAELYAALAEMEIVFPAKAGEVITEEERSTNVYNKGLEISSRLDPRERTFEPLLHEFVGRYNVRKIALQRSSRERFEKESNLVYETLGKIKEAKRVSRNLRQGAKVMDINSLVTEVNLYRVTNNTPPKNVIRKAMLLVLRAQDHEQAYRLLSGE